MQNSTNWKDNWLSGDSEGDQSSGPQYPKDWRYNPETGESLLRGASPEFSTTPGDWSYDPVTGDYISAGTYDPDGSYYVDPNRSGDNAASQTRADLARQQWEDYKARFQPVEDELFRRYSSRDDLNDMLGDARDTTNAQFGIARAGMERNAGRYGLNRTQRQKGARDDQLGLAKALTTTNLENTTRQQWEDERNRLLTGAGGVKGELM